MVFDKEVHKAKLAKNKAPALNVYPGFTLL